MALLIYVHMYVCNVIYMICMFMFDFNYHQYGMFYSMNPFTLSIKNKLKLHSVKQIEDMI